MVHGGIFSRGDGDLAYKNHTSENTVQHIQVNIDLDPTWMPEKDGRLPPKMQDDLAPLVNDKIRVVFKRGSKEASISVANWKVTDPLPEDVLVKLGIDVDDASLYAAASPSYVIWCCCVCNSSCCVCVCGVSRLSSA